MDDIDIVKLRVTGDGTILTAALSNKQKKVAEAILKYISSKKNFDVKSFINIKSNTSREIAALHWAVFSGYLEIVKDLINKGSEISDQNYLGSTPLNGAASNNQLEVVKVLLENNVDRNIKDKWGRIPLWYAEGERNEKYIKIIYKMDETYQKS